MAKAIGSFDLASLKNLRDDVTQYFWFESNSSSAWGSGAHVTLYPESQFTDSTSPNYMKGQNIIINTDGFSIRNGGLPMMVLGNNSLVFNIVDTTEGTFTTTATFTSTGIQIGQDGDVHMIIDEDSFSMVDGYHREFAHIGSPIGARITNTFIYSDSSIFTLSQIPSGAVTVKINGTTTSSFSVSGKTLTVTTTLTNGDEITAQYNTAAAIKYYTMGVRYGDAGEYSMAEGDYTTASGYASHAEGSETRASGEYSHAEGRDTEASGTSSHAEGYNTTALGAYSHVEGRDAYASGLYSHAEGRFTEASGSYSHAGGYATTAQRKSQTTIGEYNIADTGGTDETTRGNYAFIIGNGTANNAKSNALTVDWDGDVCLALDTTASSGTDGDLYSKIKALSWQGSVIV